MDPTCSPIVVSIAPASLRWPSARTGLTPNPGGPELSAELGHRVVSHEEHKGVPPYENVPKEMLPIVALHPNRESLDFSIEGFYLYR